MDYKIDKTKKLTVTKGANNLSVLYCQTKKEPVTILDLNRPTIVEPFIDRKGECKGLIIRVDDSFSGRYYVGFDAEAHRYIRKTLTPLCEILGYTKKATKELIKKLDS